MRILYLSQLVPYPADAGPKIRSYHVLQYLAEAGHQVTLLAFRRESDQPESVEHLRQYCCEVQSVPMRRSRFQDARHLAQSLLSGYPFLISRDSMKSMHLAVRRLLASQVFDAIHADQLWMAQYALAAGKYYQGDGHLQTVLDQHNAVYLIPKRMAEGTSNPVKRAILTVESRSLSRYEVETCHRFDHVVWVTAEDRAAVKHQQTNIDKSLSLSGSYNGRRLTHDMVIPICVDLETKPAIAQTTRPRRVTFLGGLHWPPNAEGMIWFVREVWPSVRSQVSDAVLTIIGKNPPAEITHIASIADDIEVTGYVADPTPYLAETAAFIVPLHAGGGMRVKIIDAWSWGLPIVSTSIGAEGILYQAGENLLIANSAEPFAQAVVRLLQQPDLVTRLGAAGRCTVESQYDWRRVYQAWDQIYPTKS